MLDAYLLDRSGRLLTEVIGLGLKPVGQQSDDLEKWIWRLNWTETAQGLEEDAAGPWLILKDWVGMSKTLRERVRTTRTEGCIALYQYYRRHASAQR